MDSSYRFCTSCRIPLLSLPNKPGLWGWSFPSWSVQTDWHYLFWWIQCIWVLRFSTQWILRFRLGSSGMWHHVVWWVSTNTSEVPDASIFRVKDWTELGKRYLCTKLNSITSQRSKTELLHFYSPTHSHYVTYSFQLSVYNCNCVFILCYSWLFFFFCAWTYSYIGRWQKWIPSLFIFNCWC